MRYKAPCISWKFREDWFGHLGGEGKRTSTNVAIPKPIGFDKSHTVNLVKIIMIAKEGKPHQNQLDKLVHSKQ